MVPQKHLGSVAGTAALSITCTGTGNRAKLTVASFIIHDVDRQAASSPQSPRSRRPYDGSGRATDGADVPNCQQTF
jgi:hypothetical protein